MKKLSILFLLILFFSVSFGSVFAQKVEVSSPIEIDFSKPKVGASTPLTSPALLSASSSESGLNLKMTSLAVSNLEISASSFKVGEKVSGGFTLKNSSPYDIHGINYAVYLSGKNNVVRPSYLPSNFPLASPHFYIHSFNGYQNYTERINLKADASRNISFDYILPKNLVGGDYFLWVAVYPERGGGFFGEAKTLKIAGVKDALLSISSNYFSRKAEGVTVYDEPGASPIFKKGEEVKLIYQIQNSFPQAVEIFPHLIIKKTNDMGAVISEMDLASATLTSGSQSLFITLPSLSPGKYFGEVSFFFKFKNGASGKIPANNISRFGFAVAGEQAEIKSLYVDEKGVGFVKYGARVFASREKEDGQDFNVKFKISDLEFGRDLITQEQRVNFSGSGESGSYKTLVFNLNISEPRYPVYEVSVIKGGRLLDSYKLAPNGEPRVNKTAEPLSRGYTSITILLIGILLTIFLAVILKIKKRREGMMVIVAAIALFGGYGYSRAEVRVDYNATAGSDWRIVQSPYFSTPADNTVFKVGDTINVDVRSNNANLGTPHGCPDHPGIFSGQSIAVLSNVPAKNPIPGQESNLSNLRSNNFAQYFQEANYKKINLNFYGYDSYMAGCLIYRQYVLSGPMLIPDKGSKNQAFDGKNYLYVVNDGAFVIHENVTITGLSYALTSYPESRTASVGQTAPYSIKVIPDQVTTFVPNEPAEVDYKAPFSGYSNTTWVFWDSPQADLEYKSGDDINFQAGSFSESNRVGTNECSRINWFGSSLATAVISDGEPERPNQVMTKADIDARFVSTNYAILGKVDSSLLVGYNRDCTLWFRLNVSGARPAPANGSRGSLLGSLNLYLIHEGDLGGFTAHQRIRLTPTPAVGRPVITSYFNDPVRAFPLQIAGLDQRFYEFQLQPSNLISPAGNNKYNPVTLNVKLKSYSEEACPPGSWDWRDWGGGCYDPLIEQFVPPINQTVSPTPGTYKFKVRGVSEGVYAGITKETADLVLVIIANGPPPAFDNLRLNGAVTCGIVPLAWDPATGHSGYRLNRRDFAAGTTKSYDLLSGTTNYIDNDPALVSGNYYSYTVQAYNPNGSNISNALTVLIPSCAAPDLPDLIISSGPSLNQGVLEAGKTVNFKAAVKNQGALGAVGEFQNRFQIDENNDGSIERTLAPHPRLTDLNIGASKNIISADWVNIKEGTHRIIVCADEPNNAINESNESNNCSPSSGSVGVITVIKAPKPTISLSASPNPVSTGTPTMLFWNATDVTSSDLTPCAASSNPAGLWPGQAKKAAAGSQLSGNINQVTTFTLQCTGPGGVSVKTITVRPGGIEEIKP